MTRALRREFAQADILSAAAGIIAQHGYHGTSMRDLAKATGRGLSSLYTYFPSKDALLFAIQTRAFDTLITSAEAVVPDDQPAERRLYAFILNHVRYFLSHPDVMRILVTEPGALPGRYRKRLRDRKDRYFAMAQDIVTTLGARRNNRRATSAQEVERTTYGLFGLINFAWTWYEPARHGEPRDVARSLHTLIVRGATGQDPDPASWDDVEDAMGHARIHSPLTAAAHVN